MNGPQRSSFEESVGRARFVGFGSTEFNVFRFGATRPGRLPNPELGRGEEEGKLVGKSDPSVTFCERLAFVQIKSLRCDFDVINTCNNGVSAPLSPVLGFMS